MYISSDIQRLFVSPSFPVHLGSGGETPNCAMHHRSFAVDAWSMTSIKAAWITCDKMSNKGILASPDFTSLNINGFSPKASFLVVLQAASSNVPVFVRICGFLDFAKATETD